MRRLKHFLAVAGLSIMASSANAVVVDFEDLNGSGLLTSTYAGLTWSQSWQYYGTSQSPYNPSSGTQRVYQNSSIPTFFSFNTDVVFDGAFFAGFNSVSYSLFNDGVLKHQSGSINLGGSGTPTFLASGYTDLVDKVLLHVTNGSFVMDDVTYHVAEESSNVPEPATLAILGIGLAGLAASRRKKRRPADQL